MLISLPVSAQREVRLHC